MNEAKLDIKLKKIRFGDLKPYLNNPRDNAKAVDPVKRSIEDFGYKVPIIVDKDNVVVAGHTRIKSLIKAGIAEDQEITVVDASDLTPEQAKAFRIADNKSAEFAEFDLGVLAVELGELEKLDVDLDSTLFDEGEISQLFDKVGLSDVKEDDFTPPKEAKYKVEEGDVFLLGRHRLMCGDATKRKDVERLMDGRKADNMVFTDPPYDFEFNKLKESFEIAKRFSDLIFWMGSDKQASFLSQDNSFTHFFIHDYKIPTLISNNQPMTQHNMICKFGNKKINNLKDAFSTVLRIASMRTQKDKDVKHEKRVELPRQFIVHYTKKNDVVLDVFGGSGSTLIAAEQTGRVCYILELDPFCCSVIIERWEGLTGGKAEKQ